MVDMNWFFLLVIALACAPVLGCLWWVVTSKIRDRRRTRIAERMSQTYYHEAVKVPGREPERRSRRASDARDAESSGERSLSTGERAALRDTGERAAAGGRAGRRQDAPAGAGPWPAEEPDPVEPVCCSPRQTAQHDGPCDCWEDTEIFEVRDGLPAVPMVPRAPRRAAGRPAPGQPPAAGQPPVGRAGPPPAAPQQPGRPPAAAQQTGAPAAPQQPDAVPPAASAAPGGPPPHRSAEWRPPERPQQHPAPRNPVERRPADAQRPPAARPPVERPVPPRPADRPQRPPAQRRERYPADRRDGRPQRGERRPVERTAAGQPVPPRRDVWPPANAVGEPAPSGKHHRD